VPRRDEHGKQRASLGLEGLDIGWRRRAHGRSPKVARLALLEQQSRPGKAVDGFQRRKGGAQRV
jgi:hypothetical protein